jgi:hypothetical protein
VICYLMTLLVAGLMAARAVVTTPEDCQKLAQRLLANDPLLQGKKAEVSCEALPMYFRSLEVLTTPDQTLPR